METQFLTLRFPKRTFLIHSMFSFRLHMYDSKPLVYKENPKGASMFWNEEWFNVRSWRPALSEVFFLIFSTTYG